MGAEWGGRQQQAPLDQDIQLALAQAYMRGWEDSRTFPNHVPNAVQAKVVDGQPEITVRVAGHILTR